MMGVNGGVVQDVLMHFIAFNLETPSHNCYLPPAHNPLGYANLG